MKIARKLIIILLLLLSAVAFARERDPLRKPERGCERLGWSLPKRLKLFSNLPRCAPGCH